MLRHSAPHSSRPLRGRASGEGLAPPRRSRSRTAPGSRAAAGLAPRTSPCGSPLRDCSFPLACFLPPAAARGLLNGTKARAAVRLTPWRLLPACGRAPGVYSPPTCSSAQLACSRITGSGVGQRAGEDRGVGGVARVAQRHGGVAAQPGTSPASRRCPGSAGELLLAQCQQFGRQWRFRLRPGANAGSRHGWARRFQGHTSWQMSQPKTRSPIAARSSGMLPGAR